jgi:nucleoside-diphosphate-sugar epimerase
MSKSQTISIIGGSGFVGTRLINKLLAAGYNLRIIDKNESKKYLDLWIYPNVCKPDLLERSLIGSDIIINLAAEHRDDVTPSHYMTMSM